MHSATKPVRDNERRESFELDDRLNLKLDKNLAWELAMCLSDEQPENPAVRTLGQSLFRISKPFYVKGHFGATYDDLKAEMDEYRARTRVA